MLVISCIYLSVTTGKYSTNNVVNFQIWKYCTVTNNYINQNIAHKLPPHYGMGNSRNKIKHTNSI